MDEIIKLLMNMGKTKEEAIEFVGKEMPKGGIDDVGSNIIKPITKKVAGDYPLIGSRITDPTQQGQFGKFFVQTLDPKDRYNLIRQSIDDQKENWQKTFEFIRTGGYKLSNLQKQNLNYNLGVLQRSKIVLSDITKGLESQKINVEDLYSSFVKNKRFLGNESTGLSAEGNEILEYINKSKEKIEDLTKTGRKQEEILSQQKKDNDARMKRLYNGRAYEKNAGSYRALGGYHLPKLHEAGIINLDPKIYEAIKKGEYHHGGADFFAPDPNRILQYHFGSKIFDDLDDVIDKAAMNGEVPLKGPEGMIKFLKDNDYLPFNLDKDGPANALDYLNGVEKLERIKELDSVTKTIKLGQSSFFKTPDQIMQRVMQNANDKFQYLDSLKRTHPGKFKLYQKNISEEPFFGVDIGQNDLFSDLSDLTFPKDKGDLIKFPKKDYDDALFNQKAKKEIEKNVNKQKEDLKKIDEIENLSSDLKVLSGKDAENVLNKLLKKSEELNKKTDQETGKNITQLKEGQTIKLDELPIRLIKNFDTDFRLNDLTNEGYTKEQAEVLIKAKNILKAGEETSANEALLRVKEEMADQQGIDVDEVDFDFQLENPEPIDDFAKGGRVNFRRGSRYSQSRSPGHPSNRGKKSFSQSNSPGHPSNRGKQSSNTSKFSQSNSPGHPSNRGKQPSNTSKFSQKNSPGHPSNRVNYGGSQYTASKPKPKPKTKPSQIQKNKYSDLKTGPYLGSTINYKKSYNPITNWKDHAILSNMLKKQMIPGKNIPNYHKIAAYDFDKRFNLPNPVSKALATGYQYLTEGYKSLTGNKPFSEAMDTAKKEANLNKLGIDGLNKTDMDNYNKAFDYSNIKTTDDMRIFQAKYLADGGIISLRNKK